SSFRHGSMLHRKEARSLLYFVYTLLGAILNWDPKEIEGFVNRLPAKRVRSMQELEWLMRGHDTATITGLSSKLLLTATHLNAHIPHPDWQLVGKAVIAAQKP
ncbi:hypothetical protein, partial [Pseudomonas helleri]